MRIERILLGILCLGLILVGIGLITYKPPLLDEGGRSPGERIFDLLAFSWHYSKALWFENTRRPRLAEQEKSRAAWFRPALLEALLGVKSHEPYELGIEFEKRGLPLMASRLFYSAFQKSPSDPELVLKILIYCQSLDRWEEVEKIAAHLSPPLGEEVKGYYWWGKALFQQGEPKRALEMLLKAAALSPPLADTYFQLGRAYRSLGRGESVRESLIRAVELLPSHGEAWQSLAEECRQSSDLDNWEKLRARASPFTPSTITKASFGNRIMIIGFDLPAPRLKGEEKFGLTCYYQVLYPHPPSVSALLILKAGDIRAVSRSQKLELEGWVPGAVRTAGWRFDLPADICPGLYQIELGFSEEPGNPLHRVGSREESLLAGEVEILPAVFDLPYPEMKLKELFGERVLDLRKTFVLAGRSEVSQVVDLDQPASALGIISYTQNSIRIPQGTPVAEIEIETASGSVYRYPVRMGVETADLWLANRELENREHQLARIYRSREIKRGKEKAVVNNYYSVFEIPQAEFIRKIGARYTYPAQGCLFIKDIFFLLEE